MTGLHRSLFVIAALVAAWPARADTSGIEITPFGGYRFGGNFEVEAPAGEYKLDDSASVGLLVNWRHQANTHWEILYSRQSSTAVFSDSSAGLPPVDVEQHVLQLGGTYRGDGEKAWPYLAATLGGTHVRADSGDSSSDTFFSGSIGIGVRYMPTPNLGLRLEARAYATFLNSSTDLFCDLGPDTGVCEISVRGDLVSQVETFAGIVFRF